MPSIAFVGGPFDGEIKEIGLRQWNSGEIDIVDPDEPDTYHRYLETGRVSRAKGQNVYIYQYEED